MSKQITNAEKNFCKLLVFGGAKYQYKPEACYRKAILHLTDEEGLAVQKDALESADIVIKSKRLQHAPRIVEYIRELLDSKKNEHEVMILREMVMDTAKNVMVETASHTSYDEDGNTIVSPSMRQTSLKAAEFLTKMVPSIKEDDANENHLGTANITLNVVPQIVKPKDE